MKPCFIFHNWIYYSEERPNYIKNRKITMRIRECKSCGIREHGMMPKMSGFNQEWKPIPSLPNYNNQEKK